MKIPIAIFICISICSAQSIGSNSSVLESKVGGGYNVDREFNLKYTAFLVSRDGTIEGMLTYINKGNCITTRDLAAQVRENKANYRALTPAYVKPGRYKIKSVFPSLENQIVVAWYGILKLERPCVDGLRYITFVNPRLPTFEMERDYFAGGWGTNQDAPGLRYLRMKLEPFSECKEVITSLYNAVVHNLACATTESGFFHEIEIGTPLFSSSNELLGIAIRLGLQHLKYTIFALVYNDVEFIERFIDNIPETLPENTDGDEGKGKAPVWSESTDLEPTRELSTRNFLEMSNIRAGHTDTGRVKGKGKARVEYPNTDLQLGSGVNTQYYHDMGDAYASHTDPHHQYDMGNHFQRHQIPQQVTDLNDLMGNLQPLRPIHTEMSQSFNAHQFPDGSHTALPYRTASDTFNTQEESGFLDTARVIGRNPTANPRRKASRRRE